MTSTLVAPAYTEVDKIPLGRRIEEIKKERGGYYSNVAMAARLGIHHETLRLMLKSKREIYTFELDKIAKDLKMSTERILQEDIKKEVEWLSSSLKSMTDATKCLELAFRLVDNATGLTERCHALHRLGKAHYNAYRFKESNEVLVRVHQMALEIKDIYGETDTLYGMIYHLMESFTAIQDCATASKLLDEIKPFFVATPSRQSSICYQLAIIEENKGDILKARQFAIESLNYAQENGKPILIAKTRLNLAHFEYLTLDYNSSRQLLELAIEGLTDDIRTRVIARKELVKSFLKLEMKQEAIAQIELAQIEAQQLNWSDMLDKLQILISDATENPSFAQAIFDDHTLKLKIRYLACKYLQSHYKRIGDGSKFLHYHEEAEKMCVEFSDFLDEREL